MRKYFIILLLLIASILFLPTVVNAADVYIRDGASGTWATTQCDSWASARACDDLPAALVRGNTYWIADGSYARHIFNDTEVGDTYITVKKATADAHGPGDDWDNAYGDGQASFATVIGGAYESGTKFRKGYYIFDGVTGSGATTSSYGFIISGTDISKNQYLIGVPMLGESSYQVDHITISHVALIASGKHTVEATKNCIYSNPSDGNESRDITISNNYLVGGNVPLMANQAVNWIIRDNYFDENWSATGAIDGYDEHGQQISIGASSYIYIYNNTFNDTVMYVLSAHNQGGGNDHFIIYNNLVINANVDHVFGMGESAEYDGVTYSEIHHNTIINSTIGGQGFVNSGQLSDVSAMHNHVYNNLFYGTSNPRLNNWVSVTVGEVTGGVVHDYNAYLGCTGTITTATNNQVDSEATSAIFTNYAKGDYTIAAANQAAIDHIIGKGKTLASPFDIDRTTPTPLTRTAPFDIGAYDVGGSADSTAPTLAEVTPVTTPSSNQAPVYVFSSDEAGTVTYGGTCGNGSLSTAVVGNNSTSWNLPVGTYSDCTVTVTDAALNASTPLAITEFVITPVISSASKVIEGGVVFQRLP
jgi:hypothetical protein